jgi:hypothetical protein
MNAMPSFIGSAAHAAVAGEPTPSAARSTGAAVHCHAIVPGGERSPITAARSSASRELDSRRPGIDDPQKMGREHCHLLRLLGVGYRDGSIREPAAPRASRAEIFFRKAATSVLAKIEAPTGYRSGLLTLPPQVPSAPFRANERGRSKASRKKSSPRPSGDLDGAKPATLSLCRGGQGSVPAGMQ